MNKHERIKRIQTDGISRQELIKYVDEAEATEKAYEELQRDIHHYISLKECPKGMSIDDWKAEREVLEIRLLKVGNE